MFFKRRILFLLISLLIVAVVGTACTTPQTVTVVETVEVEVVKEVEVIVDPTACNLDAPVSPTTIEVIGWSFPLTDFYGEEFEKCNEVENLEVNVQLLDGPGAQEQVRLALSGGGTSPFGVVYASVTEITPWGAPGWLLPLNDLVEEYREEYDLDDIPQTAWNSSTINGQIFGVPVAANTYMFYYRPDLFEKYNLEVPTNYDEVIATCAVLKDEPSIDIPFVMSLHAGWAWEIEFFHFFRSFGGEAYLNDDNTPAFNSPEAVEGLTKMKEVIDACMGVDGLTYSVDDMEVGMGNGSIASMNLWASRGIGTEDPERSELAGQIEYAPAPAPKPGGLLGGSAWYGYWTIPKTSEIDPDLAFRLIMEIADYRSQADNAALNNIVSRTSVGEAGIGPRFLPVIGETIEKGVGIYRPNPANTLAQAALGNWLPLVGVGDLSAQEALNNAAQDYIEEATAQGYIE